MIHKDKKNKRKEEEFNEAKHINGDEYKWGEETT
jgi:hypothetical protein